MELKLRMKKAWRISTYLLVPPIIGVFLVADFYFLTQRSVNVIGAAIVIVVSLGMIALLTYGIIEAASGVYTFGRDHISYVSKFHNRTLPFSEVHGYRIDKNYVHIIPKRANQKEIKVSTYTEQDQNIIHFLHQFFPDLDSEDARQAQADILNDPEFGKGVEERIRKLQQASIAAKIVNITGSAVAAWLIFFPNPYAAVVITAIIFQAIPLIAIFRYRGLIHIDERKNNPHPTIIYGVALPSLCLLIRALFDYELQDYDPLWRYMIPLTLLLTAGYLYATREFKGRKIMDYVTMLIISMIMLAYSYGTSVIVNCYFDKSEPRVFDATVTKKNFSRGKTTTYYLYLTPWGPRKEVDRISVSRSEYDSLDVGEKVDVYLKKGILNASWLYITEK